MRVFEEFSAAMADAGVAGWGSAAFDSLRPHMDSRQLAGAQKLCPSPSGVIVAAFPYYAGRQAGNISLYARAEDYHAVLMHRLEFISGILMKRYPKRRFVPLVDASPLPEKVAAREAGIGFVGNNSLIYCEPYGSFVFLGCILTDLPLENSGTGYQHCCGCLKCVAACPGGALKTVGEKVIFDPGLCLSFVTQKKGELSSEQRESVRTGGSIWGCDVCQTVCPMNEKAARTPISAFKGEAGSPICKSLSPGELSGLTEEDFQRLYGNRAFAWRGKTVLLRNLEILSGS